MVNINKIISNSFLYNLHSHTQFCDGHADMRQFVEEAVNEGFTDYGFSPHSPIPISSPCNMKKEDTDKYSEEFQKLKAEFGSRINLYKSMEIDYLSEDWGPSNSYFDSLDLDYRIGSVHFIPCEDSFVDTDGSFDNFKKRMNEFFDNNIEYVVKTFYNQTLRMIEKGGFEIIGHFDKIGQNASQFKDGIESEDWYRKLVSEVIDAICDTKLTVEINTKSYATKNRFFPNERYFSILKRYGVPVVFNSDAHYPALINSGRKEAYTLYYK